MLYSILLTWGFAKKKKKLNLLFKLNVKYSPYSKLNTKQGKGYSHSYLNSFSSYTNSLNQQIINL